MAIKSFPKVSNLDIICGAYPNDWFKKILSCDAEPDKKWTDMFSDLFFNGGTIPIDKELPEEYIQKGLRILKAVMGSFKPKHEHKKSGCAAILKSICK